MPSSSRKLRLGQQVSHFLLNIRLRRHARSGGDVCRRHSAAASNATTAAQPLLDPAGAADPLKWTARYNGSLFDGVSLALLSFDTIEVAMTVVGAEAGTDVCAYSNAPSDIGDSLGRQLAAFSAFPLA